MLTALVFSVLFLVGVQCQDGGNIPAAATDTDAETAAAAADPLDLTGGDAVITGNSYRSRGSKWSKKSSSRDWRKKSSSKDWRKKSSSSSDWKKKSWDSRSGGWQKPPAPKCPFGLAQIWFGSLSHIPYGYQVCDGSNGTPDLRDRFVIGAGSQFPFSTAGGNVEITLTEAQLAPHKHGAGSLMANTAGEHTHRFRTKVDGGEHKHFQFDLNADPAGGHAHDLNLDTGSGGDHNHKFDIYEQADYDTPEGHQIFDIPLDAVDKSQSYPKEVSDHLGHTHPVQGMTEPVDDHTHTISGYIGKDGDHCHDIDALTDAAGAHEHPIVGDTDIAGEGAPINIMNPYHALYFICCGKQEYPSWKKSKYH
jgi:hypothetical protein